MYEIKKQEVSLHQRVQNSRSHLSWAYLQRTPTFVNGVLNNGPGQGRFENFKYLPKLHFCSSYIWLKFSVPFNLLFQEWTLLFW